MKTKKLSKKVERALDQGKVLRGKKKRMNITIGKGVDSLNKFLNGGPRGEAAQDCYDRGW
jgi:hypothetical protein